jgi:large subunit ribosomal protein L29
MAEIKDMSIEDMKKSVIEKREALRTFRFGGAGSRTRNTREGRTLRKDIARLLTELRSRELTK